MNNYPAWWDKTLTIYNKRIDSATQQVSWYRTILTGCFWKYVNSRYFLGRSNSDGVVVETKDVICRIPKDERFVDKAEWKELSEQEIKEHFTLGNGDIIVLGEVEDAIDEYTKGSRSSDLVAKYKELNGCIEVDTYVINVGVGLGMEHYRVVGL